ncbi:MAG TPA: hypothetical protein DDY13_01440 [Cytophagales bacterium]|jgi:hypothetical protein|nr:hypothetical protein [Cytophagales bacterium]
MKAKGTVISSIHNFVKENFNGQYDQFKNALSQESKAIYNNAILATDWYDIHSGVIEPTKLIGKLYYNGDVKKAAWESGYYSAQSNLTGIYKVFVMVSTPQFMMARASKILKSFYDPTLIVVFDKGDKFMELHITEFGYPNEVLEWRIQGWMQKALEICGCKNLDIKITKSMARKDAITAFKINWE